MRKYLTNARPKSSNANIKYCGPCLVSRSLASSLSIFSSCTISISLDDTILCINLILWLASSTSWGSNTDQASLAWLQAMASQCRLLSQRLHKRTRWLQWLSGITKEAITISWLIYFILWSQHPDDDTAKLARILAPLNHISSSFWLN